MKQTSAPRLLRNAEPEALSGGAANIIPLPAATASPAVAVPVAEALAATAPLVPVAAVEAPAAAPIAEPSFLQKASAAFASKAAILSERDQAMASLSQANGELTTLRAEVATLRSENATLKGERLQLSQLIETATAEAKDVDTAAAAQIAALAFEPAALPSASSDAVETREQLEAKLAKATTNQERWDISEKLNALD